MSLEQVSLVAQIVSALAIIASLIFVGVQLRQATSAMRNSSSQAHSAIYTGLVSTIIENADFASIWRRGLNDPSSLTEDDWVPSSPIRAPSSVSLNHRACSGSRACWTRNIGKMSKPR